MGIDGLRKFLREKNPAIFKTVHLSNYRYKKIAVDANLYMYKFYTGHKDDPKDTQETGTKSKKWIQRFIELVSCLRENDIHPLFVFDNPQVGKEKTKVRERRQKQKEDSIEKVVILQAAMEKYHGTGEIDKVLIDFQEKKKIVSTSLLKRTTSFNEIEVQSAINSLQNQIPHFDPEDYDLVKSLLSLLGVSYVQAPEEAEKLLADLCLQKKVETALTDDSDIVVYGTPVSIYDIDVFRSTAIQVEYADILEALEFTPAQFTDFCIMCGCDPNDHQNIPKYGPKKSYNLLKDFIDIETIRDECKLDVSPLEHEMCRAYFTNHKKIKIDIPYCSIPDFEELEKFMQEYGLKHNVDRLRKNTICKVETEEDE